MNKLAPTTRLIVDDARSDPTRPIRENPGAAVLMIQDGEHTRSKLREFMSRPHLHPRDLRAYLTPGDSQSITSMNSEYIRDLARWLQSNRVPCCAILPGAAGTLN